MSTKKEGEKISVKIGDKEINVTIKDIDKEQFLHHVKYTQNILIDLKKKYPTFTWHDIFMIFILNECEKNVLSQSQVEHKLNHILKLL